MAATQPAPVPAHELVYEPQQLPKLRSNFGAHLDQDTVGWMRETPIDTPWEEMRSRFQEEGYIFVKNVMPREDVYDMREAYFKHLEPTGILKPGTSPRDGIFRDGEDPIVHNGVGGTDLPADIERQNKLTSAHTMPLYLAFLEHPKLRTFIKDFVQWEKDVLIARTMLRHNVPNGLSTGIHYDKIFLRAGEADFLTAWVPIGDCTAQGGGLMYLEDSSDIGRDMEADFNRRAERFTPEERISGFNQNMARDGQLSHNVIDFTNDVLNGNFGDKSKKRRWLAGNFEAGDVVFHNPYLIHGAVKNEDPEGRIRLSTDLRFYEAGTALDKRWMEVWRPNDGL
ncbi:hypothetical protein LTR37_005958 [Vermiconidia calcicola]|uniref:Uncharacterized protein n=1 Tax=Vermiconidia calcicola TaxID=1690605 RepID=A0ACC3NI97_9PEZI|nr:hypothetical protein LTR37_005958 [Vermiconidia calcicola]